MRVIGIIGGGVTGLSVGYYLSKVPGFKPIVFEKTNRVGGWVHSTRAHGALFESGPRSIRPVGIPGLNTLDLIEELGIAKHVVYVEKNHPVNKQRMIFHDGRLVTLPQDVSVLYRTTPPFSGPLVSAVLRDIFTFRHKCEDDSVDAFVRRRFGGEVADLVLSSVIRGICGGDSRQISVKFLMKTLFDLEQSHGSVVLGAVASRFKKQPVEDDKGIGFSNIALSSLGNGWAIYSFEDGVETLTRALADKQPAVGYTEVKKIEFRDQVVVHTSQDSVVCDHVVSCVPAEALANMIQVDGVNDILSQIKSLDMVVTGLCFDNMEFDQRGFGFLVPRTNDSVPGLLGVVFDTNCFSNHDKTVITAMCSEELSERTLLEYVSRTLGINRKPDFIHSMVLRKCIPQYTVGHYERVETVKRLLGKLPITVAGASFDGVSVNDCVFSGLNAANRVRGIFAGDE